MFGLCGSPKTNADVEKQVVVESSPAASAPATQPKLLAPEQIGEAIPAILQLGQAHFTSQCLYAVVKLGVPNIVGDGQLTAAQIASKLPGEPNVDALLRCLRILSLSGIFVESEGAGGDYAFGLSTTGALLQTGLQQPNMSCGVLHWMEKPMWGAWSELPDFVAGKKAAGEKAAAGEAAEKAAEKPCPFTIFNKTANVFDFYGKHPESAAPFNEFMSFFSAGELPVVVEHAGWAGLAGKTVVDVGGSYGAVMGAVAEKFPEVTCISFDLPEVIEKAGTAPKGVSFAKGDMFSAGAIPKCDTIFMKHILHDWDDEASVRILRACGEALPPEGQVLICEAVLPEPGKSTPADAPAIFLDTLMMLIGGKERSQRQWEALAEASGYKVAEVRQNASPTAKVVVLRKQSEA